MGGRELGRLMLPAYSFAAKCGIKWLSDDRCAVGQNCSDRLDHKLQDRKERQKADRFSRHQSSNIIGSPQ
jgi:hypothetical protein